MTNVKKVKRPTESLQSLECNNFRLMYHQSVEIIKYIKALEAVKDAAHKFRHDDDVSIYSKTNLDNWEAVLDALDAFDE